MQKQNIYIMYTIALLQGMVFYSPIATLYRQSAGLSIFQITIIESISLGLMILFELPWGIVADYIGYKKSMIICICLFFFSKIIFWQADNFIMFLIERIILSIVVAGLSGLDTSILYLSVPLEKAQHVFSIYNNLGTVGLLLASGIYTIFIKDNFRLASFLTMITYGIAAIISLALKEVKGEIKNIDINQSIKSFKLCFIDLKNHKTFILFLLSIALIRETHQTITVFFNQLQYIKCGASNNTIGLIYIFITLAGLLSIFSVSLTIKFGEKKLMSNLIIIIIVSCLMLSFTNNIIISITAVAMIQIAYRLIQPLELTIQNRQITSSDRATRLSMNAVIIDGIAIFTNIFYGKIADINISYAMFLGFILCGLAHIFYHSWLNS